MESWPTMREKKQGNKMIKKVNEQIRALIRNGVRTRQRSIFVITGDKFHDQIANLYYILSRQPVRKEVVWCYGDALGLSSFLRPKLKLSELLTFFRRDGTFDPEKGPPPFSFFLEAAPITFCRYKNSERILGNTFGMCVLQDFEALTPNLLARTIERVDSGGLVILLIRSSSSLTGSGLYTNFREPSRAKCDFIDLKKQLDDDFPVAPLIGSCFTSDQTLSSMMALLAGCGHGKSAALGLAVAGAVAAGYSNIFVTAPSPENLKTLLEFLSKGFDELDYKKHVDYDIVESSSPIIKKYIQPHEHGKLLQAELLGIDEAAAIPLPVLNSLLGPYLVFLSSTVNGYEGTGQSWSLKLVQQLDEQSQTSTKSIDAVPCG